MRLLVTSLALLILLPAQGIAQNAGLRGQVLDQASRAPVVGVQLRLTNSLDTTETHGAITDDEGSFAIAGLSLRAYRLDAARIGYAPLRQTVKIERPSQDAGAILMTSVALPGEGIAVEGQAPTAIQKSDTTEFAARAFKTHRDANAEDLAKKLPGITIDNGAVKSNGETVRQVLVDGKPFFGGDPMIALRNLPADVIDKIQVYDKLSDQSEFTGFDDGQSVRTMNVSLRSDRRRAQFGKVYAGHGDQGRYHAGGNQTIVRGASRWSLIGLANNVNQQNFSAQDLLGVLNTGDGQRSRSPGGSGEGRRFGGGGRERGPGGGPGGGGGPFGGASGGGSGPGSFFVGPQDGVVSTTSLGSNFSGPLSSRLQANASYFFNRTDTENTQRLLRRYSVPLDSIALYEQTTGTDARNDNQRFDSRLEWNPDSSSSFVLQPRLYFQRNRAANDLSGVNLSTTGAALTRAENDNASTTSGNNLSGRVIARHKFPTRGRTLSVDLGGGGTLRDHSGDLHSRVDYPQSGAASDTIDERTTLRTTTGSLSGRAVYTEPLGSGALLQLFYQPSGTVSRSRSRAFLLDSLTGEYTEPDSRLTNTFENTSVSHNGGVGVLVRRSGLNLTASVGFQRSSLRSEQTFPRGPTVSRVFHDVLPSLMLNLSTPNRRNLRVSFMTATRPPSIAQLQNVADNSNPLILTTGNPDLEPSTTRTLVTRYSRTDAARSRSLFAMFSVQHTGRYIANQTLTATRDTVVAGGLLLKQGTQLVGPVNLEGAWNAGSFLTYSRPVGRLQSVLNLSGGLTYTRTPGRVGGVETLANTWSLNPGVVLSSNISPDLDFTLSYNGTYNLVRNALDSASHGDYYTHSVGLKLNLTTWNGIVLRDEVSNALTSGVSGGYDQNVVLWNSSVGKKLFKDDRGEIRLAGTDVLGQSRSTRRSATETYVQDVRNRTLGKYVMLTFTYTLR